MASHSRHALVGLQRRRVLGFEVRFKLNEELICVAHLLHHFFFVNSIAEQVVRTIKSDFCSYHVMVDCYITQLFGHLHIRLLGVGKNPQYIVGDKGLKH